jgi:hypothetical protein
MISRERPLLWRALAGGHAPQLFRRDRLSLDAIVQLAIALLSPAAILLIAGSGPSARWGFVVGLISQPFWIYATARSRQLGMLAVAVLYLAIWILGIVNHFPELLS